MGRAPLLLLLLVPGLGAPPPAGGLLDDDACMASAGACGVGLLQHAGGKRRGAELAAGGEAPSEMVAAKFVGWDVVATTVAVPNLAPGQALVKVNASSVNPSDWKFRLAGSDFAGVVQNSKAPCPFSVGDEVWGNAPHGAWAEYVAVDCDIVGRIPRTLEFAEAGALPHVALTALQAFKMAGAPWDTKPTVVVLGGSGGVGHVAVQLAKDLGAGTVVTTASAANADFVMKLGADRAIDFHTTNWWTELGPDSADIVLDAVGQAGTGDHALETLRKGGHYITLLGEGLPKKTKEGVNQAFCFLSSTQTQFLDEVAALVDAGKLSVTLDGAYPLASISEAVAKSKEGHTVGKMSIQIK